VRRLLGDLASVGTPDAPATGAALFNTVGGGRAHPNTVGGGRALPNTVGGGADDPALLGAMQAVHPLLGAQGEALLRCLLAAAAEAAPLPAIPAIGAALGALIWHVPGWREGGAAVLWARAALSPQAPHGTRDPRDPAEAARANLLHAITRVAEAAAASAATSAAPHAAARCGGAGLGASWPVEAVRDATVEFARAYRGLRSASDVYDAASGWA
jgi:hypothetical protein